MQQVYFIVGGGKTKIGISISPEKRLAEFRVGSPASLTIAYAAEGAHILEHKIWTYLAARHSHGEWFHGEVDPLEAAAIVACARDNEVRGVPARVANQGEIPRCSCHEKPMRWSKSARRRGGGYWRCAVYA